MLGKREGEKSDKAGPSRGQALIQSPNPGANNNNNNNRLTTSFGSVRSRQTSRARMESVMNETVQAEYKWKSNNFQVWFGQTHLTYGGMAKARDECVEPLLVEYINEFDRFANFAFEQAEKVLEQTEKNPKQFDQGFQNLKDPQRLMVYTLYPDKWNVQGGFFNYAWTVDDLKLRASTFIDTFQRKKDLFQDILKSVEGYLILDNTKRVEIMNYNKEKHLDQKRTQLLKFYQNLTDQTIIPQISQYSYQQMGGLRDFAKVLEMLVAGRYKTIAQDLILEEIVEFIINLPDLEYEETVQIGPNSSHISHKISENINNKRKPRERNNDDESPVPASSGICNGDCQIC